jgi:hypothetical protein
MSKKEFAAFINRQPPPEEPIDWNAQKDEWLKFLNDLYEMLETFLKEFVESGHITLKYKNIAITEDDIGRYTTRALTLTFGANSITLTPIGTMLINTKGRVDMTGPKGTVRLLLADKDATGLGWASQAGRQPVRVRDPNSPAVEEPEKQVNWEWKIAVPNTPRLTYQKLTQETFLDAIMEVANG